MFLINFDIKINRCNLLVAIISLASAMKVEIQNKGAVKLRIKKNINRRINAEIHHMIETNNYCRLPSPNWSIWTLRELNDFRNRYWRDFNAGFYYQHFHPTDPKIEFYRQMMKTAVWRMLEIFEEIRKRRSTSCQLI